MIDVDCYVGITNDFINKFCNELSIGSDIHV